MDSFNEELFLAKEWLVKVDAHTSTPYLIKFHSSPVDLTCAIMITDTKRTWAESLSSKQFARRWRECNKRVDSPPLDDDDEEAWRTRSLEFLSRAHTLGAMLELSFDVVESKFGDFTFQLECNTFKWRWETIFVGYKPSADVLSKHLIMPLISVNHLAFSSSDVIGDLPPTDLDKAVDKIARTARRTVDTHVKNALSKPRLATTIRRITAVFNFISDPPNVSTEVDVPELLPPPETTPQREKSPERPRSTHTAKPELNVGLWSRQDPTEFKNRDDASVNSKRDSVSLSRRPSSINQGSRSDSATEPEDDTWIKPAKPSAGSSRVDADQPPDVRMRSPSPKPKAPPSDSDSSPVRPIKKSKPRAPSSDEDSEEERKKLAAQIKRGTASAPGLRQPIKRGGKRF